MHTMVQINCAELKYFLLVMKYSVYLKLIITFILFISNASYKYMVNTLPGQEHLSIHITPLLRSPEEVHVEDGPGSEAREEVEEDRDEDASQPGALRPHEVPVQLGAVCNRAVTSEVLVAL